jgi:DNA-binding HxlR family transcriptional regulator
MGYHMLRSADAVKKAPQRHLISAAKPHKAERSADPYNAKCPTRMVLDRIGDKWTVLVLGLLSARPLRFNQLRREIDGLTQKMLSQTLKALERDGLVTRKVTPTVPVSVEYSITPLGATLSATLDQLQLWARAHIGEVIKAQKRYDQAVRL